MDPSDYRAQILQAVDFSLSCVANHEGSERARLALVARRQTEHYAALGPASVAMATLGLWIADRATKPRVDSRTPLREWLVANREAPSGLCLAAGITWFVSMAVPTVTTIVLFAALEAAGVDLRWWGWLPAFFLTAAVVGFAVNGWRDLMNSNAIPTLAADVLIGVLVLVSTLTIFGLQQTALG